MLGEELDDAEETAVGIAQRYDAVVSCQGFVAAPTSGPWQVATGHSGLGTAGSGDVLAAAIAGLAARVGRLGFLARELLDELPLVLVELGQ